MELTLRLAAPIDAESAEWFNRILHECMYIFELKPASLNYNADEGTLCMTIRRRLASGPKGKRKLRWLVMYPALKKMAWVQSSIIIRDVISIDMPEYSSEIDGWLLMDGYMWVEKGNPPVLYVTQERYPDEAGTWGAKIVLTSIDFALVDVADPS